MPLLSVWTSTKYILQFHKFQAIFHCLFNNFACNYHLKKLYHTKNTSFPQIWWLFTFLNSILWYLKVLLVVKTYKDKFIVITKKWKKIVNLYLVGSPSPRYALQYPNPSCQLSLIIPFLVSIKISSSRSPCKNVVFTSSCSNWRFILAANPCITQIEHIFTTYENISSKLVPCFWPNPFTTNRVFYFNNFSLSFFGLNTHLFLSAFLPFGSSINLYVWFFHKEFIFSCMNFIQ